ncbi:MAG: hypothetical protein HYR85_12640 [Planctomycetes bacterium]|nr:hypothetical protein [Planctomycetota bacterium]MBI3844308.1 hypothetical protein [Planctomycetota bacterium]
MSEEPNATPETELTAADLVFRDEDFDAFKKEKWRSPLFNNERLKTRRKLTAMGKRIFVKLAEAGLALEMQASLSHPYTFNKYSVDSLWVYWSRADSERKKLKRVLGHELGKDLDPNYTHCILVIGLDVSKVELAMRVHSAAWWDGQNLKNKCRTEAAVREWTSILNALPGFVLNIHDWKKEYRCGTLLPGEVANFFEYFVPGEHWLHLRRAIPRDDAQLASPTFVDAAAADLVKLVPAYRFVAWSPTNDFLALRA